MVLVEDIFLIAVILRGVVAQDVLQTCFQGMNLCKWRGIVYLEGMLHRTLTAIVILILQALQEVLPTIGGLHIKVICVGLALVRLMLNLIRKCQQALRHRETALIVDTTIDVTIVIFGMAVGGISVKRCLRQGRGGYCGAVTVAFVTPTIEVERSGEQTEGINLVTGLKGTKLRVPVSFGRTFTFEVRGRNGNIADGLTATA